MALQLVVKNTDDDLKNAKLDKQLLHIKCKACGYKYMASVGEMVDKPECRKCGA